MRLNWHALVPPTKGGQIRPNSWLLLLVRLGGWISETRQSLDTPFPSPGIRAYYLYHVLPTIYRPPSTKYVSLEEASNLHYNIKNLEALR